MRKKKTTLLPLIIFLSFIAIVLVSLLIPNTPNLPGTPKSSSFPLLPKFSFRDFAPNHEQPVTLLATGDIMLGRYCNVQMLKNKDWKYPFLKTASLTSSADIAFGNLEVPIVENCPTTETGMIFCARPESIEGLKFAGFDILSLANNHILNHGQKGLEQTKNLLENSGILFSPQNPQYPPQPPINPTTKTVNNIKFGFLSFDLVSYPQTSLIPQTSLTSPTVDVLIVSLHWGNEYQKTPSQNQKDLAHQIIDAGAKIIIGHHPHVTQPVEKYKDGLIFYSLGNFIFDQPWSEETKKGNIAKIIFEGKNIKSYEIIPIYIEDYCQPKLLQ